jgi:hypothetical protein
MVRRAHPPKELFGTGDGKEMVFHGLRVKTKIPLNPPFLKGGWGDFSAMGVRQTFGSWTFKRSIILVPHTVAAYFNSYSGVC